MHAALTRAALYRPGFAPTVIASLRKASRTWFYRHMKDFSSSTSMVTSKNMQPTV